MNIKIIIGIINSSLLASLLCFMLTIFLWILRQHLLLQSEQIGCRYTFPTSFLFCCYFNQGTNYSTSPTHLIFNLLKYFLRESSIHLWWATIHSLSVPIQPASIQVKGGRTLFRWSSLEYTTIFGQGISL